MNSSLEGIDPFHSFWYNYDSWREFSYLNEEEKEKIIWWEEMDWKTEQQQGHKGKKEINRIRTLVVNAVIQW